MKKSLGDAGIYYYISPYDEMKKENARYEIPG